VSFIFRLHGVVLWLVRYSVSDWRLSMHVSAAYQGSEPVVNQEESNDKLTPCVHCQESDNGSLPLSVPFQLATFSVTVYITHAQES